MLASRGEGAMIWGKPSEGEKTIIGTKPLMCVSFIAQSKKWKPLLST